MRFPTVSSLSMMFLLAVSPASAQSVRPLSGTGPAPPSSVVNGVSWLRAEQIEIAPVSRPSPLGTLRSDFRRFIGTGNLGLLGAIGVATLASHSLDQIGREESREHLGHGPFAWGNVGGSLLVQGGGALAAWTLGKVAHAPRLTVLGGDLIEAQLVSQTFVQGLKHTVRRSRPDGSNSLSFPSGHTASAFATATVLQRHLGWKTGAPAYAFATYVGAARMASDKHYLSDVVLGAGIGLVAGRAVTVGLGTQRFVVQVAPAAGRGAMVTFTRE